MRTVKWIFAFCAAASSVSGAYAASGAHENQERPDIEIWLGEGIGRYGDREFTIRGGSEKNPTPTGAFTVEWKSRKWWSKQYDAAMPYAMFYHEGAALHQGVLRGHSHGCVRLSEADAKYLYGVTKEQKTRVFVYP